MKFVCDNCGTQYLISDDKIGSKGAKVRCKRCGNIIVVRPAEAEPEVTLPRAAALQSPEGDEDGRGGVPAGGGDEVGAAFDQLLRDGLDAGAEDDDEDEQRATEIFSLQDIEKMRRVGDGSEEQRKIDDAFSARSASGVGEPEGRTAERSEWYVAVGQEQLGPLGLLELESRWTAGEIFPETLCWQPGMRDWQALQDTPELRYLLGSRTAPSAQPAASSKPPAAEPEAPEWASVQRSELAALVEEEIAAVQSKPPEDKPEERKDAGLLDEPLGGPLGDDDVPPWERDDVVSGEVARPSDAFFDSSLDASPRTGSGAYFESTMSRSSRVLAGPAYLGGSKKAKSKMRLVIAGGASLVVLIVAAMVVVFWPGSKTADEGPGTKGPLERPVGVNAPDATGTPAAAPDAGSDPAGAAGNPGKSGTDAAAEAPKADGGAELAGPDKPDEPKVIVVKRPGGPGDKPPVREPKPPRRDPTGGKKKIRTEVAATEPRDKPPPPPKPQEDSGTSKGLSKEQIGGTIKKYLGAMKGCVKEQVQRDPSVTGTMVVSFTILNSGKVGNVTVVTGEHQGTYVAGCITYIIKAINFPKFSGDPVTVPKLPLHLGGG